MSLVKGMHHAALRCVGEEELNSVVKFYCNVLGMKFVRSWGSGIYKVVMVDTGSGIIEIFADALPGRRPGQVDHIALATDDVDACVAACRENGLPVLQEPGDLLIPSGQPYPIRIAFVLGKAGEIIEFFHER